eukprot:PITA_36620
MDKFVEEYEDIFTSPAGVPLHYQVKHSIDLTPGASFPNGPIYRHSVLENDEIKTQIQELLQKGHIRPISSPSGSPIVLGENYFSKIDSKSRYHQVPIEPSAVWKTTFKAKEGLFKWLVISFRLTNSLSTFMRLMDDIFWPFTNSFIVVYLDDILIFSQSWEEHLHHIQDLVYGIHC